jgi:hypothetical protein
VSKRPSSAAIDEQNRECELCSGFGGTRWVSFHDTSGATQCPFCPYCIDTLREGKQAVQEGACVLCGSTEDPSRSRGVTVELYEHFPVCDDCRLQTLRPGAHPEVAE